MISINIIEFIQFKYSINNYLALLFIKARICRIVIFTVKSICYKPQALAEALIMNNLTLPQKFYRLNNIRIVNKPQNIIIGYSCFLLCCKHPRTTIGLKIGVFMSICVMCNAIRPRKNFGYKAHRKKQGEGVMVYVEPLLRSNAVAGRIFDGMIRSSSEFRWERPLSPEFACRPTHNQSAFPPFHG